MDLTHLCGVVRNVDKVDIQNLLIYPKLKTSPAEMKWEEEDKMKEKKNRRGWKEGGTFSGGSQIFLN